MNLHNRVLRTLLAHGRIKTDDSVLVVGDQSQALALKDLGFHYATRSSAEGSAIPPVDWVLVFDALCECRFPQVVLSEICGAARKGVAAVELRDTLFARALVRLGLSSDYRTRPSAVDVGGRIRMKQELRHVYRWTPREIGATVWRALPTHKVRIHYGVARVGVAAWLP